MGHPAWVCQAMVLFAGNTDDVLDHKDWMTRAFPNHTLYLMPYRGYSGQHGLPTEKAIKRDAVALIERVARDHAKVDVLGRSLGTGVALHVAAQKDSPVQRLALITPYDSLLAIAQERYPWVPVKWFLQDRFDSVRDAPKAECPMLVVTAGMDTVVPPARAEALMTHLTCEVEHVHVARANHRTICWQVEAQIALRRFFQAEAALSPEAAVVELLARHRTVSS